MIISIRFNNFRQVLSTQANGLDTKEYLQWLKCAVPAVDDLVKESPFEKMWNGNYRPTILGAQKKIETCQIKKDTGYVSWCYISFEFNIKRSLNYDLKILFSQVHQIRNWQSQQNVPQLYRENNWSKERIRVSLWNFTCSLMLITSFSIF